MFMGQKCGALLSLYFRQPSGCLFLYRICQSKVTKKEALHHHIKMWNREEEALFTYLFPLLEANHLTRSFNKPEKKVADLQGNMLLILAASF
jgi:hypothetical protein